MMTAKTADQDLRFRVTEFLERQNRFALRHVVVEALNGCVTLKGEVSSFYEKQLCLQCARHVAGVMSLVDELEVAPSTRVVGA